MFKALVKIKKNRKRVGRGGDRGGTSGKGHKGQKARSGGKVASYFEGGQMPLTRRLPKRGFNNARFRNEYEVINLSDLESRDFDAFADTLITKEVLVSVGLLKKATLKVKLLGRGVITKKISIEVDACSQSARSLIEKNNGSVSISQ